MKRCQCETEHFISAILIFSILKKIPSFKCPLLYYNTTTTNNNKILIGCFHIIQILVYCNYKFNVILVIHVTFQTYMLLTIEPEKNTTLRIFLKLGKSCLFGKCLTYFF